MKFLCDRCKTRYSIGDDRVRGKILKIRCKNCANVITVREGMPDADAVVAPQPAAGAVRKTRTTGAPPIAAEAPAARSTGPMASIGATASSNPAASNGSGNKALGAAFASAMTKPPPALDEEWYVSIDGDQEGPYSLAEAQRWVGAKAFDAELHCWSEGFDDWLPVDKVSHFRGLRKKPAPPPLPPPVPPRPGVSTRPTTAVAGRTAQAVALRKPEEEPKPLFAATMASLEKSSSQKTSAPAVAANGGLRVEARSNGVALPTTLPAPRPGLPAVKPATTVKGLGLKPATAQKLGFEPDLVTTPEMPAFQDEVATAAEPAVARRLAADFAGANAVARRAEVIDSIAKDAAEVPKRIPLSALAGGAAAERAPLASTAALADTAPAGVGRLESVPEPDLDIGEVSRVVKLADIMRPAATTKRTGAVPKLSGDRTGSVERVSARLGAAGAVPLIDAVDALPGAGLAPSPLEAAAPIVAVSHRRGLIALLVGALLLVGIAVVVVVMVLNKGEDTTTIGSEYNYTGERPDQPTVRRPGDPTAEPTNPFIPPKPPPKRIQYPTGSQKELPPPQPTGGLKTDEIEAMGRKYNDSTLACFRRADKGADSIRLADVKKVILSFKVASDGSVSEVNVSEKSSAVLVACLQRVAGSWRFRPNPGGNYGLVLAKPE